MRMFSQVQIGDTFTFNGSVWLKRSSRSAQVSLPKRSGPPWFYFSGKDIVDRVKPENLFNF